MTRADRWASGLSWFVVLMAGAVVMPRCANAEGWKAELVMTIAGFDVPECVAVDQATGYAYVSNISGAEDTYWADDGEAFISRLKPGGELDDLRWCDEALSPGLNAPKGMCVLEGILYIADNTRVARFDIEEGKLLDPLAPRGAVRLNDMATDGESAYVSDTGGGRIYRIRGETIRRIAAPGSANGMAFGPEGMYCVSWDLHDIFRLSGSRREEPSALGLAEEFVNLDGVEILEDGSLLVSDCTGGRIAVVSPDGTSVETLVEAATPADIGLDRERGLLYIPLFNDSQVAVYRLSRE